MDQQAIASDLIRRSEAILQMARGNLPPGDVTALRLAELQQKIGQHRLSGTSKNPAAAAAVILVVGLLDLALMLLTLALAVLVAASLSTPRPRDDEYVEQLNHAIRTADIVLPQLRTRLADAGIRDRLGNCQPNADNVAAIIGRLVTQISRTALHRPGVSSRPAADLQRDLLNQLEEALNSLLTCVGTETELGRELREVILGRQPALKFIVRLLGEIIISLRS